MHSAMAYKTVYGHHSTADSYVEKPTNHSGSNNYEIRFLLDDFTFDGLQI